MKEVTYEDWQKNPTPRMMWVWDDNENNKEQRKVLYIIDKPITYQVIALIKSELSTESFMHCAEIEKSKTRRMTCKEFSRWLRENPTREYRYTTSNYIFTSSDYRENNQDKEVHGDIMVRENDGEWKEPLIEEEL